MHIPSFVINDLKSRVALHQVIDRELGLNKLTATSGSNSSFMACCPFHNEKNPSFSINDEIGQYHCFGCGEKGDVIDLYMTHLEKSFPETIKKLAELTGVDLEAIIKDVESISTAPTPPSNRHILRLTNLIFNKYSLYDPYKQGTARFLSKIQLPTSLNEMKYTMSATNYLFDSKDGSSIAHIVNNESELTSAAQFLGLIDENTKAFKYVKNHCFLPIFTLSHELDGGSNLPYVVNPSNRTLQFHCTGFVVLDNEMEHVGYYPKSSVSSYSGLLLPPPHITDTVDRINKLYITDSPEQFIDLVCCGVKNVISPAHDKLNHQHLRQISEMPVDELHWVTTKETLAHPQIISRLSLFNECIGTGKRIYLTIVKNNEDNTPFSSMIVDHKEYALESIETKKMPLGQIMRIALPTIYELGASQRSYALESLYTYIRKCIRSGTENEVSDAIELCCAIINSEHHTLFECISKVSKIPKKDIHHVLDFSTPSPQTIPESLRALHSEHRDIMILKGRIEQYITKKPNLFENLQIHNDSVAIAETVFIEINRKHPELILTNTNANRPHIT